MKKIIIVFFISFTILGIYFIVIDALMNEINDINKRMKLYEYRIKDLESKQTTRFLKMAAKSRMGTSNINFEMWKVITK